MHMPYELLDKITDGFSHEIGRGTFGVVYKGKDEDGQEIAVKVLDEFKDLDGNAFRKEFNNLTKLEHPNIIRLIGFCDDEKSELIAHNGKTIIGSKLRRALCFEYLHNGSLENHLSDEHQGFDWQKRYTIIKGICMGLKYLHVELESPVHHLDLKPGNILVGDNMVPKIADFGLSRLLGEATSKKTLSVLGTLGYCPPEYINHGTISKEFDIFSLGVIIIKIICGSAVHSPGDDKTRKFISQVCKKWRKRLLAIPRYTSIDVDCQCKQVKKCIEIALNCTIKDLKKRPDIGSIVEQLAETEKHINDKANSMKKSHARTSSLPKHLQATFLKEITLNFSTEREIDHSAFGTLYKGILPEGGIVAVQRLAENAPVASDRIFDAVVGNLVALKHENIVQLVGFHRDEPQKKVIQHNGRNVIVDMTESCIWYEYLHRGSLDKHIYAGTSSIDWDTRFKIINGICKGLHFLHKELDRPLIHLDLNPSSIWLDDNWVPKIADFGLCRLFGEEQTRINTIFVVGKHGYMAPEYLYRGEISTMSDIYSLGMVILETTTGNKIITSDNKDLITSENKHMAAREFVDKVRENWNTYEEMIYKYPSLDANALQQVKACIEIGLKCVDIDRNKRPTIVDIVDRLNALMVDTPSPDEITPTFPMQLYVHTRQLLFPFEPNKWLSCPLRLTNTTDEYLAARLLTKNPKRFVAAALLCGVVPPRSTYTLVVTVKQLPADEVLSLESCVVRNKGVNLENKANPQSVGIALKDIFRKRSGAHNVYEQKLKVGFDSPKLTTYDQPFQYEIEIISDKNFSHVTCVDVHPMEPWIMTSHESGDIFIWDYEEQKIESSFDFTQQISVNSVRFIAREGEEWFVAGDGEGIIHVYNYETDEKVTSFQAHDDAITSLAVHPTHPLVISSSDDYLIKMWNWEKGWNNNPTETFEGHSDAVKHVIFNPVHTDTFASASLDQTIKFWNISSSECQKTLSDDLVGLPCVLTYTGDTGQRLVTGSWDGTTQIWDLETETCVQTLEGHTGRIAAVYRHPELPVLLTGSHDGTVRTWNSDTYRPQDIFGIKLGAVSAFAYIKSVKRIVVACHQGIAIMEMK